MKTHRWSDLKRRKFSEEDIIRIKHEAKAELLNLNLKALREELGLTQVELAEKMEVAQSHLSRIENREDHLISTLRKYVEALGGSVEVHAVFEEKSVKLTGV